MMDPLTAIGLVGNIVQFIDFGIKIVSKSGEIYSSAVGTSKENTDVEIVTQKLQKICDNFTTTKPSNDPVLDQLCASCSSVAQELLAQLRKVKVSKGASKWKSIRMALKTVWSKDEISSLRSRLLEYRQQLTLHLMGDLRKTLGKVSLEQANGFHALDDTLKQRANAIVSAIQQNLDVFRACVAAQNTYLADLQRQTNVLVISEHNATRQHVSKETHHIQFETQQSLISATNKINSVASQEHTVTRDAIIDKLTQESQVTRQQIDEFKRDLETAREQIKNEIQKNNELLKATIDAFTSTRDVKAQAQLKEKSNALTTAVIALQTVYDLFSTLLLSIQTTAKLVVNDPMIMRLLTAYTSFRRSSSAHPADGGAKGRQDIVLSVTDRDAVLRTTLLAHYNYYYFHFAPMGPWNSDETVWANHALHIISHHGKSPHSQIADVAREDPRFKAVMSLLWEEDGPLNHKANAYALKMGSSQRNCCYLERNIAFGKGSLWKLIVTTAIIALIPPSALKTHCLFSCFPDPSTSHVAYSSYEIRSTNSRLHLDRLEDDMKIWLAVAEDCGLMAQLRQDERCGLFKQGHDERSTTSREFLKLVVWIFDEKDKGLYTITDRFLSDFVRLLHELRIPFFRWMSPPSIDLLNPNALVLQKDTLYYPAEDIRI